MIRIQDVMDVLSLKRQGLSLRAIARKLGVDRHTVAKYLEEPERPRYKSGKRQSKLLKFQGLIEQYLEQDDYQAAWIHDRLQKLGYQGSYDTVKR